MSDKEIAMHLTMKILELDSKLFPSNMRTNEYNDATERGEQIGNVVNTLYKQIYDNISSIK